MVKGLDRFKEYFSDYEGNYVIIGGTACNVYEEMMAQEPRATKDIDLILIVATRLRRRGITFVSKMKSFLKILTLPTGPFSFAESS